MDETNVLDEMPAEEITQTEKKSRGRTQIYLSSRPKGAVYRRKAP